MAADDQSKTGPGSGSGANQPSQAERDAKRAKRTSLDTQSLRVLAPRNEVARSALEMRQNLEKYMPPGPQRDQLIAQLKEDVTPLLTPELEKSKREAVAGARDSEKEREERLNQAIDRAAKLIKGHLGQFENFGPVSPVDSVAAAVVERLRQVLHDPRRDKGEFQIAVCVKEKKIFTTSRYFEPSSIETFAYERQTAEGLSDLQISGYRIAALIHAHQATFGKDTAHFSNADIEQADNLQSIYEDVAVQSFLLTPAPDNHVLVYSPNAKDKLPLGEMVGEFSDDGNFYIKNDTYTPAFQKAKLIVS